MKVTDKRITTFLFAVQGVGVVFIVFFLAAYLAGLPTTVVYHSEPVFRIPLFALGALLLVLVLCAVVVAAFVKKT